MEVVAYQPMGSRMPRVLGMLCSSHLLLSPMRWLMPMDHSHGFKKAIVAAKHKKQEAKDILLACVSSWLLVGTLLCGISFEMLIEDQEAARDQDAHLLHQIHLQVVAMAAFVTFTGPVVLGAVVYVNVAACAPEHLAVFVSMARRLLQLRACRHKA